MSFIQANTNGVLHNAAEPSLSPLNRGFLYGDAIYEVWRSYDGVLFAWEDHWARLEASAASLGLELIWSKQEVVTEIKRTVLAFRKRTQVITDVYVRFQVYRGEGAIGLDTELADKPGYIILVQPVPVMTAEKLAHGYSLHVAEELKRNPVDSLNPAWKSGNYLNNLLCLREAKRAGKDDAVILNHAGYITEATTSNIAFVRGGAFITPALSVGILVGITRKIIIEQLAASIGLRVEETALSPAALSSMDECMLLSSTKDVQPVGRIDEHRYLVSPDSMTSKLKKAFARFAADYARKHPELAL